MANNNVKKLTKQYLDIVNALNHPLYDLNKADDARLESLFGLSGASVLKALDEYKAELERPNDPSDLSLKEAIQRAIFDKIPEAERQGKSTAEILEDPRIDWTILESAYASKNISYNKVKNDIIMIFGKDMPNGLGVESAGIKANLNQLNYQGEANHAREQLAQSQIEINNLIAERDALVGAVVDGYLDSESLRDKIDELNNKIALKQAELDEAITLLAERQTELSQANMISALTQAELVEANIIIAQKQAELDAANALVAQKQAELDAANALLASGTLLAQLQQDLNDARSLVAQKQAELDAANATIAQKQTELDNANALAIRNADTADYYRDSLVKANTQLVDEEIRKKRWRNGAIAGIATTALSLGILIAVLVSQGKTIDEIKAKGLDNQNFRDYVTAEQGELASFNKLFEELRIGGLSDEEVTQLKSEIAKRQATDNAEFGYSSTNEMNLILENAIQVDQLSNLQQKYDDLEDKYDILNAKGDPSSADYINLLHEIITLSEFCQDRFEDNILTEAERSDIQAKIDALANYRDDTINELASRFGLSLEEVLNSVEYQLATLNGQLSELTEENASLEAEKNQLVADKDELANKIAEKDAIIAEKDATIAEKEALIAEKDEIIANNNLSTSEKDALIASLNSQIAEKDKTIDELNKQIEEKDAKLAESERKIAELESELAEQIETIIALNDVIEDLQEQLKNNGNDEALVAQLAQAKKDLALANAKVITQSNEIEKLKAQIEEIKKLNSDLTAENNALTAANKQLSEENASLESENSGLKSENDKLKESNNELASLVTDLSSDISELEAEISTLTQNNSDLTAENASLTEEVASYISQLQEANKKYDEAIVLYNQAISDYNAKVAEYESLVAEYEDYKSQNGSNADYEARIAELEEELSAKTIELSNANQKIDEQDTKLAELEEQVKNLTNQLASNDSTFIRSLYTKLTGKSAEGMTDEQIKNYLADAFDLNMDSSGSDANENEGSAPSM